MRGPLESTEAHAGAETPRAVRLGVEREFTEDAAREELEFGADEAVDEPSLLFCAAACLGETKPAVNYINQQRFDKGKQLVL
jgi:hypothetical protein